MPVSTPLTLGNHCVLGHPFSSSSPFSYREAKGTTRTTAFDRIHSAYYNRYMVDFTGMTEDEVWDIEREARKRRKVLSRERLRAWQARELEKGEDCWPWGACTISDYCEDLVFHAKRLGRPVKGDFNGTTVTGYPDSSPGDLERLWWSGRKK